MSFIKLTCDSDGKAAWVKDHRISCLVEESGYTDVYLHGDSTPLSVKETPEQIMNLLLE